MKKYFKILFIFILAFALTVVTGCGKKDEPEEQKAVAISAEEAYEELGATLVETAKDITALSIQGEANAKAVAAGEQDFTLKGEIDAQVDADVNNPRYSSLLKVTMNGSPLLVAENYLYHGKEYSYNYSNIFGESKNYSCEEAVFEKPDMTEFDAEFVSNLVKKLVAAQLNVTASKKDDVLSINLNVSQSELSKLYSFVYAEFNNGTLPEEDNVNEVLNAVKLNKCEFSIKLTGNNKLEIDANIDADIQYTVPSEENSELEEPTYIDGNIKLDLTLDIIFNSANPKFDDKRLAEIENLSTDVDYSMDEIETMFNKFNHYDYPFVIMNLTTSDEMFDVSAIHDEENRYFYGKTNIASDYEGDKKIAVVEIYCVEKDESYVIVTYLDKTVKSTDESDSLISESIINMVLDYYGYSIDEASFANLEHPDSFCFTFDVVDEAYNPIMNVELLIQNGQIIKCEITLIFIELILSIEADYTGIGYEPMDLSQVLTDFEENNHLE